MPGWFEGFLLRSLDPNGSVPNRDDSEAKKMIVYASTKRSAAKLIIYPRFLSQIILTKSNGVAYKKKCFYICLTMVIL